MELVLLIGARAYRLSDRDARWLEERIRTTCIDDLARPLDSDALACLNLAGILSEDLDAGQHDEPIELGRSHAVGLTEHVLTRTAAVEHDVEALFDALVRFRS